MSNISSSIKIRRQSVVLVCIIIYCVSCKNGSSQIGFKKTMVDSLTDIVPAAKLFYQQKDELNEIVLVLRENPLIRAERTLTIFTPDNFEISLQSKIKKAGIKEFLYYATYCDSSPTPYNLTFEFDFTTNWSDSIPIHICRKPCSDEENRLGNYSKHTNGNEVWGLGDNWVIWYERFPVKSDTFPPKYSF